jgi:hypothetical protein
MTVAAAAEGVTGHQVLDGAPTARTATDDDPFTLGILHAREQATAGTNTSATRAARRRIGRAAQYLVRRVVS